MATSIREFNVGLYREHLEEASFIYDTSRSYLHDPELNWPDLEPWEERFEAHLDALVVGGDPALQICQQADVADAGQVHAALRLFSRQRRKSDLFAMLAAVDPGDEATVHAAADALCRESPRGWLTDILDAIQRDNGPLIQILARVVGYRRCPSEHVLAQKLAEQTVLGRVELAWALGRVGTAATTPVLNSLLDDEDRRVCEAAAIALMRLGDVGPLHLAMTAVGNHSWARRVLAVGGGLNSVGALLHVVSGEQADADAVLGLGLLGHLMAVPRLLDLLDHEQLSQPAAVALNTITGAQLYASVFIPDEFDLAELSDEEREAFARDGTVPTRGGEPYGSSERRPLLEKARWHDWLDQNKHRFNRALRWRMGQPYGPAALFECLRCETSPHAVRAATYEELVVRYGLDVPFEADLSVALQRRLLGKIGNWVERHAPDFQDGSWYFAGRIQK